MSKQKKIASAVIALIAWTVLGALVGAGGGYVVYVRQPAVFQSSGTIQIASVSPDAPLGSSESETSGNGVSFIASKPVLSKAAKLGRLGRLAGITGGSPEEVAEAIQNSGNLEVESSTVDELGRTYEVRYRGSTPSAAQQVVQFILEATVQSLTEADNTANWDESLKLLTEARAEIETSIADLETQLNQLGAPDEVAMVDGELVSAVSQQYVRLRSEAYQLQELRNALSQKLRRVETLIQNGASSDAILAALDVPTMPAVVKQTDGRQNTDAANDAAERERQLASRLRAERDIKRQMLPLQQELDKMLERFGSQHPTVVFKRSQIEELQEKLDALPPLLGEDESRPIEDGSTKGDQPDEEAVSEDEAREVATKIMASLRALRSEKKQVEQDFEQIASELDEAATALAQEENADIERSRLLSQLESEQELLQQAAARLKELSARPPFPAVRAAVLREPDRGQQVAPELNPLLVRGAQIGLVVGLVLVSLLYLTSLATSD